MKRTNTCFALSEFLCNLPVATVSEFVEVDPDILSVLTRRDPPFTGFTSRGFLYYKPEATYILNKIWWIDHRPVFLDWKTTRPWDLNNTHHVKSAFTYLAEVVIPQVKITCFFSRRKGGTKISTPFFIDINVDVCKLSLSNSLLLPLQL